MQSTNDLYKILGLSSSASQDDIRKAHRKLVRAYHPDANPQDPTAEERFKAVQQAYEVLSNENKRQEYDKRFHTSSKGSSGRPRARGAGVKTKGESTSTVTLSDLLDKLKDTFKDARARRSSATNEDLSGPIAFGASKNPREKKVKGPKAQRKEKRVKGPSTRRERRSD